MVENSMIDVLGIVAFVGELETIFRKNNSKVKKSTMQIINMSDCTINVTIWGVCSVMEGSEIQSLVNLGPHPIIAFKCVRISDFYGKSLGKLSNTKMFIIPSIEEATILRNWCEKHGKIYGGRSLTSHDELG
ncbi:hypothetical protein KI387_014497, partial [Taxus chinensis]